MTKTDLSAASISTNDQITEPVSRRRFLQGATGTALLAGAGFTTTKVIADSVIAESMSGAEGKSAPSCPVKDDEVAERYRRAERLIHGMYSDKVALNTTVYPHWVGASDCFWYMREAQDGHSFRLVDAKRVTNTAAFDHRALADCLAVVSGEPVAAAKLPIKDVEITLDPVRITFEAFNKKWIYDDNNRTCRQTDLYPDNWSVSPNGRAAAFMRDYNIWVRDLQSGEERQLTDDGERFNIYASLPTTYGRQEKPETFQGLWSPDSKRLFTLQVDTRNVKVGPPLVRYAPDTDDPRPEIINPERRIAIPGDEYIDLYQFLSIDVQSGKSQRADYRGCPVFWPPYQGYFSTHRGWWSPDNRHAYFIDLARGALEARLVEFDTDTGNTRVVIEEHSDTRFNFVPLSHLSPMLMPLPGGREVVWFSERSGWAHLYLYDIATGKLKNAITSGEWLVRNVLHFDVVRRELWIQTADRIDGRNPYYSDICRVNIDSGQLTPVLSTNHEYVVCNQRSRLSYGDFEARGGSPTGEYVVTTRSRVDQSPVSLLLDRTGKVVMELEKADVSGLPNGWQWPEPVSLTAADGKTELYGVVFRPSSFSPQRSYPVLDFSDDYYTPIGSFSNSHSGNWMYLTPAAMAELGFVVVMISSRGNGLRHNSFDNERDTQFGMASSPFWGTSLSKVDCVEGIKQLARRYPYMDVNRVGVHGGNSPAALIGMLGFPGFYKVGIAANTCADIRLTASFADYGDGESNTKPLIYDAADQLRGKLLLVHGMLDDVHPVGLTFHMIWALQKANKDFDMLVLPNDGHGQSKYATRRIWDYLLRHLAGVVPPAEFELS